MSLAFTPCLFYLSKVSVYIKHESGRVSDQICDEGLLFRPFDKQAQTYTQFPFPLLCAQSKRFPMNTIVLLPYQ